MVIRAVTKGITIASITRSAKKIERILHIPIPNIRSELLLPALGSGIES